SDIDYVENLYLFHFVKRNLYQSSFSSPVEEKIIQGGYAGLEHGYWIYQLNMRIPIFFGLDFQAIYPQEDGLPFPDNIFDFVHQDNMISILQRTQWEFVLSELIRVTKPGGYIEISETIPTFNGFGPIMQKFFNILYSSLLKQDVDVKVVYDLESMLESQPNITKVHRDEREIIMGPNSGKIGIACQEIFESFCNTKMTIEILSSETGISKEEYKRMMGDITNELKETRPEFINFRLWAQKM
ncbi:3983_t:CDS:2, partial [Funneliformis mosseae]